MENFANVVEFNAAVAAHKADELGDARARLKVLKDEIKDLENVLVEHCLATGDEVVEGSKFRVTVSRFMRATTAWKKIAMDLGASAVRIAKNTKKNAVTKVSCTAHKKEV